MTERLRVRIPAGTAGEFSSPGSTFCADSYFGIHSTPMLPQLHVKDPGHSVKSAGGRLQLNMHMVHGCTCMMYTEPACEAAVSCGTSHASAVSTPLRWIFKNMLQKASHSCRIICEHSQFAREWRIALYKQPAISQSIHSQKESHRQVKPT